jgi:hypothetical protein
MIGDHPPYPSGSKPTDAAFPAEKKSEPLSDEELVAQLAGQVQTLRSQLASVEDRYTNFSLAPRYVLLAVSAGLLIFVFAITMIPYLYSNQPTATNIPTVLTYIASFGIVIFGYLTYRSFTSIVAAIEARRTMRFILNDGARAADRAECLLTKAEDEDQ